ncbi:MAG: FG-GAP repeat domain-containing protein, partial [Hyphomicrobiales bacterium]
MRRSVLALLFGLVVSTPVTMVAAAEEPVAVPSFVEETARAGLDSRYMGDWEFMVGGGVATFDCSGDAYPDVFLSGGTAPSSLFVNRSSRGGDLRFEKVLSGLEMTGVTGAYPLDIDGDGTLDLVLLRVGENVVMRGLGGCRFERANEAWGFDGGNAWTAAFAATFERGAEWPTLAVGNYIDRAEEIFPWGTCTDNWLHRPATNGSATERRFAPP